MISDMTPLKAFGTGAFLITIGAKHWVFTLSALASLGEAALTSTERFIGFLIYVVGAKSLLIIPIVVYAVAPTQSAVLLERATEWLEKYNRPIVIAVSVIFGSFFLWKGISGLLN